MITRDTKNALLFGVCAGLSRWLWLAMNPGTLDPTAPLLRLVVRVALVVLFLGTITFHFGLAFLLYLLLACIMPSDVPPPTPGVT